MLSGKLGQITKASGTNARTSGTFVPLVTQLKYALCLWVCYHDNSKLRASILTKLGL